MRDVTYVVPYEENATIKKIIFENGMTLDLFPNVQEILYLYRQCEITASEAGGLLLGYENAINGNFTLSTITEPQITDVRTRFSLFLGNLHQKTAKKLKPPYGYIGTWHTHPSSIPSPSNTDLCDWEKCIKKNRNSTSALIFIIAGTEGYRIWAYCSKNKKLYEGKII